MHHEATFAATGVPYMRLLGPVGLINAQGMQPNRAKKRCEEYCAWILAHPGATPAHMARELLISDATRRSNMSRLRSWLGQTPSGDFYLPQAYAGRIFLHPDVSSDWEQFQLLISGGARQGSDEALTTALSLVRGIPLDGVATGDWHWSGPMQKEMMRAIREVGVVLAKRCVAVGDFTAARWAADRALAAVQEDESLWCMKLLAKHRGGDSRGVDHIALKLSRQAKMQGVDLKEETARVIRKVMEERVQRQLCQPAPAFA